MKLNGRIKKRWVVLLVVMSLLFLDYIRAKVQFFMWMKSFEENQKEFLVGEWDCCVGRKMVSISSLDKDYTPVSGVSFSLDESGTYEFCMSDSAMSFLRDHEGNPFTTNQFSGQYEVRVSRDAKSVFIDLENLGICTDRGDIDGNLFFRLHIKSEPLDVIYLLPRKTITYKKVLSRFKWKYFIKSHGRSFSHSR